MDLVELKEHIRRGENLHTELKERLGVPRELSNSRVPITPPASAARSESLYVPAAARPGSAPGA
jgi:hypothetical protein